MVLDARVLESLIDRPECVEFSETVDIWAVQKEDGNLWRGLLEDAVEVKGRHLSIGIAEEEADEGSYLVHELLRMETAHEAESDHVSVDDELLLKNLL